ncbi:uncharacterized protein LOC123530105 isoform X2 [Mercenaria mercenaria]|nr:uncharacterized protein LOC123530105 isoform X2 [Mercenaria mercenaria]
MSVYVDNAKNRKLGRVGMPKGSMPESKGAAGGGDRSGSSTRRGQAAGPSGHVASQEHVAEQNPKPGTYKDNYNNRKLGRVGLPIGSMVVSKSKGPNQAAEKDSSPANVKTEHTSKIGRGEMYEGSKRENGTGRRNTSYHEQPAYTDTVCGKSNGGTASCQNLQFNESPDKTVRPKVYVDNAQNRRLGRVGMAYGDAVIYNSGPSSPTVATKTKVYVDNPQNRRLGRVGLPIGTKVFSSMTQSVVQKNYDDTSENRKLGRVGKPRGCLPVQKKSKTTKKIPEMLKKIENGDEFKEYDFEDRGTADGDLEYGLLDCSGDREAFDQAMYRHNRYQEELSWNRNTTTKAPPKTQVEILKDYKGKKIPFTELKLRKVIGRGGFGQVFFAKWNETVVAVKKLQNEKISESRIRDFADEVMKFCTLDNPNIVKFIGACVQKPNLCIVMEYMQMTLYDAIHIRNDTEFSEEEQIEVIQQTCAGMNYLHSKRIAHCDLKTPNILLDYVQDEICEVKITDFGLSMIIHDTSVSVEELVRNIGTPQYSPPEMLRGDILSAKDMMKADVYSLALVFLEVIFKEEPYPDYTYQQLKQEVVEKKAVPEVPSDPAIDKRVSDIMRNAWSYEPLKRPSMPQIFEIVQQCQKLYRDFCMS